MVRLVTLWYIFSMSSYGYPGFKNILNRVSNNIAAGNLLSQLKTLKSGVKKYALEFLNMDGLVAKEM